MQQQLTQSEVERENKLLRAQIARLRKLLEMRAHQADADDREVQSPAVVYQIERAADGTTRFVQISDGCQAIYGLTPQEVLNDIDAVRSMTHPDDRELFFARLEESVDTLQGFSCEYRIVNARGETRYIRALCSPSRGPGGSIVWNGVLSDVTNSKSAETDLRHQVDRSQEHIRQLSALVDAGAALNAAASLDELMDIAAQLARRITRSHQSVALLTDGRTWEDAIGGVSLSDKYAEYRGDDQLPDGTGMYRLVMETQQPIRLTDAELKAHRAWRNFGASSERHPPMRGWLAVPIPGDEGKVLGLIQVSDKLEGEFTEQDELYLTQFAQMTSLELQLRKTREQIEERVRLKTADLGAEEEVLRRLLDLQERERKQISHDIHDGFIQYVMAAQMFLEALILRMTKRDTQVPSELNQVRELVDQALVEGRRMVSELRPTLIDERGLTQAVEQLVAEEKRRGLTVRLRSTLQLDHLDPNLEHAAFRIIQEALTNVRRHSQTDRATVRLTQHNGMLRMIVRDQGVGFSLDEVAHARFGLRGIQERAKLFSGSAKVFSKPGRGTLLFVEIPIVRAN